MKLRFFGICEDPISNTTIWDGYTLNEKNINIKDDKEIFLFDIVWCLEQVLIE